MIKKKITVNIFSNNNNNNGQKEIYNYSNYNK